jgi:predicted nucleic acid-binding Zn ribbon protein
MDWEQRQAFRRTRKAAGEDVRRQRQDRDDYGARTAVEARALREQAAQSATVCADCFQPLPPDASVTMENRSVRVPAHDLPYPTLGSGHVAEHDEWLRVPICLRCWLVKMTLSRPRDNSRFVTLLWSEKSGRVSWSWRAESVKRCRCEACGRPLRLYRDLYQYHTQRVCCDDCRRSMLNARARVRRRVRHQQIDCAVCGEPFTPKRNDAVTCSNRCRQKLHRQRHSSQTAKKRLANVQD